MKIQRSAFLMLAGAMAAQACVVESSEDDGDTGSGNNGSGNRDGGSGANGNGNGTANGSADAGGNGSANGGGDGGMSPDSGAPDGAASGEGGADARPDAVGSDATAVDGALTDGDLIDGASPEGGSSDGGTAEGGVCDDSDSEGGLPLCAPVASQCGSWEGDYCIASRASLKPALAEVAVACMLDNDVCAPNPYTCVRDALADACPDPTRDSVCADAIAACDGLTAPECHELVDGLSQTGVDDLYPCLEGGCTFGLWSCVEGLQ